MSDSPFTPEGAPPPVEPDALKYPNQSTVYLLCIMGAIDCLLAASRVTDEEFHAAIEQKFKNAGYAYPERPKK